MSPPQDNYTSNGEQLRDPTQIAALLRRVKDSHTLVRVVVSGTKGQYNSVFVAIEPERNYLLLDELTPREGHEAVLGGARQLRVYCQIRGVQLSFTTALTEVIPEAGGALYRIPFPSALIYQQRRASFRVPVARSAGFTITLRNDDGLFLEGSLADISTGGLRGRFPVAPHEDPMLRIGAVIDHGSIAAAKGEPFRCKLEIRFSQYLEDAKELLLGLRFHELDRLQQKRLERLVMILQRESIKKTTQS